MPPPTNSHTVTVDILAEMGLRIKTAIKPSATYAMVDAKRNLPVKNILKTDPIATMTHRAIKKGIEKSRGI